LNEGILIISKDKSIKFMNDFMTTMLNEVAFTPSKENAKALPKT